MSKKSISSRVFGANVEHRIQNIFNNIQKGSFQTDELSEVGDQYQDYLGDRTTFARMWSPVLISGSLLEEGTQKEKPYQEVLYRIVNDNRTDSYDVNELDSIGVVTELTENVEAKPTAGITDVNVATGGTLGAVKYTDISFVVFNRTDFEKIFLPYFMKPGATVVLDYGWSDKNIKLYDVKDRIDNHDVYLNDLKKFI